MLYAVAGKRELRTAARQLLMYRPLFVHPVIACLWLEYIADADLSQQRRAQQIDAHHHGYGVSGL